MISGRKRPIIPLAIAALVATGCGGGGLPAHVLRLTPESLQDRALQTRQYDGISEADLLSASTGVIQDLGFIIDESETNLGLVVGSKQRDANPDAKQVLSEVGGAILVTVLTLGALGDAAFESMRFDDYQKFWVTIVIRQPSHDDGRTHYVRVTFQRIVWNDRDEIARLQSLDEPEMYQRFFDLLSKSVFLEGKQI